MYEQLDDVAQVYGIHLMTALPTGTIGVKDGPLMAAPDKFTIAVQGKGGWSKSPLATENLREDTDGLRCPP